MIKFQLDWHDNPKPIEVESETEHFVMIRTKGGSLRRHKKVQRFESGIIYNTADEAIDAHMERLRAQVLAYQNNLVYAQEKLAKYAALHGRTP